MGVAILCYYDVVYQMLYDSQNTEALMGRDCRNIASKELHFWVSCSIQCSPTLETLSLQLSRQVK